MLEVTRMILWLLLAQSAQNADCDPVPVSWHNKVSLRAIDNSENTFPALLDTGSEISTIEADYELIPWSEGDSFQKVRIRLNFGGKQTEIIRPMVRMVSVASASGHVRNDPTVILIIKIGNREISDEFSISKDVKIPGYDIIIGRNILAKNCFAVTSN